MQFGAAMHRVLHEHFRSLSVGRRYSEPELIEIFRNELTSARLVDPVQHELYEKQGIEQLRRFLKRTDLPTDSSVIGTEQRFSITVEGTEVVGRIDRIDRIGGPDSRQVAIVDYKTGSPRSEDDAAKGLQLSVYALAAARQWGFEPARLAFHNLEDDTIVSAEPESGRLKEAEVKIARAAAGIAAGEFEPKPSPFTCKRCQYQAICPATEETLYVIRSAAKASLN
jgi:RecB family exonuclease